MSAERAGDRVVAPHSLDIHRVESFATRELGRHELQAYYAMLAATYEPLGFLIPDVLPTPDSRHFLITCKGAEAGIFRLTEVQDGGSFFYRLVPGAIGPGGVRRRLLEVNNTIVTPDFRASPALGLILYRSACEAHANGFDFVVGLTRFQVLRHYVDFGVVPIDHAPLSVLQKDHLLDFVTYFDTSSEASIEYMHERSRRYFHQHFVMHSLQEKYVRPRDRARRRSDPRRAAAVAAMHEPEALGTLGK